MDAVAARVLEGGPVSAASLGQRVGGTDRQTRNFGDVDARMKALGLNYDLGDTLMREGALGLCLISAADGDFTHRDYFCGDRYDSKVKVDGSESHDETGDEARDRLGILED